MTGAMYAAIAGLKTHMQNLNVIGNNIANVNTYGYKAQRSVFRTALYTSLSGGSNGTTTTGGMNPSQIGYGVSLAAVDIDMSTGNYALTGKPLDCMIDGDGFFLVGDKTVAATIDPTDPDTFKTLTLTRVGNFEFKADGYLTDNGGNTVYGFACVGKDLDTNAILSDQLVPLRYPKAYTNSDGTVEIIYPTADENGRLVDVLAIREAEDGTRTYITDEDDVLDTDTKLSYAIFQSTTIDPKTGKITGITSDDQNITIGYLALGTVTNPNGVTMQSDTYFKCGDGAGDMSITLLGGAAKDVIITKDPGIPRDTYRSLSVGTQLTGDYTMDESLGDVPLTKGLLYVNGYLAVKNEASVTIDEDTDEITGLGEQAKVADGGKRELITGGLEASKTDLATEISSMITTQRGYQANTRIVTVTDSMLEELVNMKR